MGARGPVWGMSGHERRTEARGRVWGMPGHERGTGARRAQGGCGARQDISVEQGPRGTVVGHARASA